MKKRYSIYEAKAKLSEIIRIVKKSNGVIITERGVDVAHVVPVTGPPVSLSDRMEELIRDGLLQPPKKAGIRLQPLTRRRGALKRFLESRD